MTVLFGLVALTALLLFLHPYVTYPLSLGLFADRPIVPLRQSIPASATLMFSARNEERSLPDKLLNLREIKARHPDLQCIAFCDASTDRTLALLEACPDLEVMSANRQTGKAAGMARMMARAAGEVCIFTDANVILAPEAVGHLLGYFADPAVGGVAGRLHYVNGSETPTAQVGSFYWRLEEVIKRLESRSGSLMGADGSIFAIRRRLYPVVPPHLLDDMTVSMAVVLNGLRLVIADDVVAFEKGATSSLEEFRRKRRIACRAYNTHRHLWPMIRQQFGAADIYKYCSHKLLRWVGAVPLAVFLLAAVAALASAQAWQALTACAVVGGGCLILALASVRPFGSLLEIVRAIVATFVGIVDAGCGKTYQTWDPAPSRH